MLAPVDLSDRLAFDVQGAQSLRAKAVAGDPEALKAAAKQFEAMVVQIMLKTMRATKFTEAGDPFGDSTSLKMYQEMLDQQWAQKMAEGKGLGFADAIVRRLGDEAAGKATMEKLARPATAAAEPAVVADPVPTQPASGGAKIKADTARPDLPRDDDHRHRFIEALLPHARQAEQATGVPARFILAHAALESGWGRREIPADDGGASHNLFGIKAVGWSGAATEVATTEYRQGLAMKVSQRFRSYADYAEAFTDYGRLLQKRYGDAAAAGDDAEAFVAGLVNGGYATDPAYAAKLHGTIRTVARVGV